MESNKLYIISAIVLVLAAGFFTYRHFSKKNTLMVHHEESFRRTTELAQKIPMAGLREMGAALNRYKKANNAYPKSLEELYPEYIPYRDFISKIKWEYQPRTDNFVLSKGVVRGSRMMVASIDSSLKTKVNTGSTAIAAQAGAASGAASGGSSGLRIPSGLELLTSLKAPGVEIEDNADLDRLGPLRGEARRVSVDESTNMPSLASSVSGTYLVWKDEKGHLGFGNVQYPNLPQFAIASRERWYNVNQQAHSQPEARAAGTGSQATATQKPGETEGNILDAMSRGAYLVWRDKNGVVGFGNVDYPDLSEIVAININGQWKKVVKAAGKEVMEDENNIN